MPSLLAAGAAISLALVYGGPGYDAFPGSVVLPDGEVLVSFRSGAEHASTDGRLMIARSEGKGMRWRVSEVYDDPRIDDRSHLGLTRLRGGRLLLPFYQYEVREGEVIVRSFVTASRDRGRTWSAPRQIAKGWLAVYGKILERPGDTLLAPAYSRHAAVLMRSGNGGKSWQRHSTIGALSETSILPIGGQKLLAVGRSPSGSGQQYLYEAQSRDGGRTWSSPLPLFPGVSPDLFTLRSGRIVLCLADRLVAQAIQCRTWSRGGGWSAPTTLWNAPDVDFGYPASVEVGAGRLVTFFYGEDDVMRVAYDGELLTASAGE
jgi:hypothetical protein